MPHKGTRSTVSVAGVGLMLPRSGGVTLEKTHDEKEGTRLSASAQNQPARTELEGVGSKPELSDEFLPTRDELTFRAFRRNFSSSSTPLFTVEISYGSKRSSDGSAVRRHLCRLLKKKL